MKAINYTIYFCLFWIGIVAIFSISSCRSDKWVYATDSGNCYFVHSSSIDEESGTISQDYIFHITTVDCKLIPDTVRKYTIKRRD